MECMKSMEGGVGIGNREWGVKEEGGSLKSKVENSVT